MMISRSISQSVRFAVGACQGFTIRCCLSASISCVLSFMLRQPKKIVRIANGSPMIAMIATRSPINHVTGVFKLSILASTYDFIRVSDAPISLLTSSLTIKRIWLRSALVNSPRAGSAIAEKSIERASIVFMGCSSVSPFIPLQRWEGGRHALRQALQCHPKLDTHIISDSGVKRQVVFDSRRPYRERHDLKTYVQLKIPATTTRTVAIQNII